jgi:UDP-2,3-diacylglucosamine pyrophosphatase LpxH
MVITTIVMDVYKPGSELKNKVVDISDSFNARVGDNQVRLVIKYVERGIVERMEQEQLTPFMMGWVGQPDEEQKVTAETGIAVSYHGSTNDIIGGGKVRMDLPGTMFPQEGMFYGFFGLENDKGKRVTTNTVRFIVENDNPDMYVDTEPFRTELQKLLDLSQALIDKYEGDLKNEIQSIRDEATELFQQLNGDYTTTQTTVTSLTTQLEELAKKIDDKGLLTKADLETYLADFKTGLEEIEANIQKELGDFQDADPLVAYFDDDVNEVGGVIPSYYRNKLNQMSSIPKDNFNIGFITDTHLQLDNYSPNSIAHYAYIAAASRRARLDAIVAGGDNTNGWWEKNQKIVETQQATSTLFNRTAAGTDVFFQIGNHDTGINQNGHNTPDTCLSESDIKAMYHTADLMYGEVRDGDSLYGYKDYSDKKVRVIWLNSFDLPYELNEDGTYKYDFLRQPSYRNQQLTWFAEKALMIPDNTWQVMVFTHAPLPDTFGVIPTEFNSDILIGILNAFQNGKAYALKDTTREMPVDISVDFSEQGSSVLIGLFSGHVHEDGQMVYSSINCIETACSLCYSGDSKRKRGTETEDCWDVFSVDTVNRKIHAYRFGYGQDRDFSY